MQPTLLGRGGERAEEEGGRAEEEGGEEEDEEDEEVKWRARRDHLSEAAVCIQDAERGGGSGEAGAGRRRVRPCVCRVWCAVFVP